jgi:hypothetical protein
MPLILTFASSHQALAAERQFLGAGLPVELIPVPRQIRSDCGFCLLADAGAGDRWLQLLGACGAQERWRVLVSEDPSLRKVKSYERLP